MSRSVRAAAASVSGAGLTAAAAFAVLSTRGRAVAAPVRLVVAAHLGLLSGAALAHRGLGEGL